MASETIGEGLTLGQMLAANLEAALRGEITAEEAQANAEAFRVPASPQPRSDKEGG